MPYTSGQTHTLSATPRKLCDPDPTRIGLVVDNEGVGSMRIGSLVDIRAGRGQLVRADGSRELFGYTGELYAVGVGGATPTMTIMEWLS